MKKEPKTVEEFIARQREINDKVGTMQGRELSQDEQLEYQALLREFEANRRTIEILNLERENQPAAKSNDQILREQMIELRNGERREITLATEIEHSGAIVKTINPVIDTRQEGLGLPKGVSVTTGVTGDEVWPSSINDVDFQEVGENEELSDQGLDFASLTPLVKRAGLSIPVSNAALDEAAFPLGAFVGGKINVARRRYLGRKVYSQAAWGDGNICGPFSGIASSGVIDCSGNSSAKQILEKIAEFVNKGLDPIEDGLCIVIDAVTEARLKVEPIVYGESAGFIIQNGKLLGYDYVVTHYINTKLNKTKTKLVGTGKHAFGIGFWNFLAVQQHGKERLTIDGNSKAVAVKNITAFVLNTRYSITRLDKELRDGDGEKISAFALYDIKFEGDGSGSGSK